MRVVAISDTHWQYKNLYIPPCDLLLHTGDLEIKDWAEAHDFAKWWDKIDAKYKVLIPGNHDLLMEHQEIDNYFHNTTVLINETVRLNNGLLIAGSPYTPTFLNWAFMETDGEELARRYTCINNDADIILVHGPLYMIHDEVNPNSEHVGSRALRCIIENLDETKHRYLFHGHIHGDSDAIRYTKFNNTCIYNVSICNEQYMPVYQPLILEI